MNKKIILLESSLFLLLIISINPVSAMQNPAFVYCNEMGYEHTIIQTSDGEVGVCKFPGGSNCTQWDFLEGYCGKEFSYCEQNGYTLKTVSDKDICSRTHTSECAVCVLGNGSEVEVTELMGLDFREGECGDGSCTTGENFGNCPQDCPSGGEDRYCDMKTDGICDPDCRGDDPDCTLKVDTTPKSVEVQTTQEAPQDNTILILAILLIVIVLLIVYLKKLKK